MVSLGDFEDAAAAVDLTPTLCDCACCAHDPPPHLACVWACKEALLKAVGTGLPLGMHRLCLRPCHSGTWTAHWSLHDIPPSPLATTTPISSCRPTSPTPSLSSRVRLFAGRLNKTHVVCVAWCGPQDPPSQPCHCEVRDATEGSDVEQGWTEYAVPLLTAQGMQDPWQLEQVQALPHAWSFSCGASVEGKEQ